MTPEQHAEARRLAEQLIELETEWRGVTKADAFSAKIYSDFENHAVAYSGRIARAYLDKCELHYRGMRMNNPLEGVSVDVKPDGTWLRIECGPQKACLNVAEIGLNSFVHGPIITKAINHLLRQLGERLATPSAGEHSPDVWTPEQLAEADKEAAALVQHFHGVSPGEAEREGLARIIHDTAMAAIEPMVYPPCNPNVWTTFAESCANQAIAAGYRLQGEK